MDASAAQRVIVIAGPTASGKSAYALKMAGECNGVIINADSLQIYHALPILTAQPSQQELAGYPHRLYGVLDPTVIGSVAEWINLAVAEIEKACASGMTPIVVGGTGLYIKSLIYGLSPLPVVADDLREQARKRQAEIGNPAFHAELAVIDPMMAARLKPNDTQRLIRAYEVIKSTGKSLAIWQETPPVPPLPTATFDTILVDGPRDVLRDRARRRLGQMVDLGVVNEVRNFSERIKRGEIAPDAVPTIALGYHAFVEAINGKITIDQAVDEAVTQTGQYIKRQQTWFRHQMPFDRTINVSV